MKTLHNNGGVSNHFFTCTKSEVCENGTFCLLFCANIVGSGLVGCCVVVFVAVVAFVVINRMREVRKIFAHLAKKSDLLAVSNA